MLAPVDDSDHSEAAVRWAATHVLRPGDVLHLLAVVRDLRTWRVSTAPWPVPAPFNTHISPIDHPSGTHPAPCFICGITLVPVSALLEPYRPRYNSSNQCCLEVVLRYVPRTV